MSLPDWMAAAAAKPLPGPFHHFEGTLHDWGYLAVGGLLFLLAMLFVASRQLRQALG